MKRLFLSLLVIIVVAFIQCWITDSYAMHWDSTIVASDWRHFGAPSLDIDDEDHPHIACTRHPGCGEDLVYFYFNGDTWELTVVDWFESVGLFPDIAMDSMSHPHISYHYWNYSKIKYAHFNGANWITQIVGNGQHSSIAIDSYNDPHIVSGNSYWYFKENNWNYVELPRDATSIDLDSSDYLHFTSDNYYCYFDGVSWQESEFTDYALESSLVLDEDDLPHIAYIDSNYKLMYAYYNGSSWDNEIVDVSEELAVESVSMDLDSQANPYISYFNRINGDFGELRCACKEKQEWEIEIIDYEIVGPKSEIRLDSQGVAHVTYSKDGNLMYASRTIPNDKPRFDALCDIWAVQGQSLEFTVTASDSDTSDIVSLYVSELPDWLCVVENTPGNPAHMVLSGTPSIDDVGDTQELTFTATDNGEPVQFVTREINLRINLDWKTEIVDSLGDVGEYCSVAVGTDDRVHIVYYDARWRSIKYAFYDGLSWQTYLLDCYGTYGTSIAVDEYNHVHIVYRTNIYRTNVNQSYYLRYAYYDGDTWTFDTLFMSSGAEVSIATYSDSRPAIFYYDNGHRYAYLDDGEWQTELIDTSGPGSSRSLKIGTDNIPRVTYRTTEGLKYAERIDSIWQTEVVDSYCEGVKCSLGLDTSNKPHIAYLSTRPSAFTFLKYACKNDDIWEVQNLGRNYSISNPSLVMDMNDRIYILFSDHFDRKFKCAYLNNGVWSFEDITERLYPSSPGRLSGCLGNDNKPIIAFHAFNDKLLLSKKTYDNHSPIITYQDEKWALVGERLEFSVTAQDSDPDDIVTLAADDLPEWLEIIENTPGNPARMTVSGIPDWGDVGGTPIFTAMDNGNPVKADSLEICINLNENWSVQKITEDFVYFCSIVVDSENNIHIVYSGRGFYSNENERVLKYAFFDGNIWSFDTVDSGQSPGLKDCSIVIDSNDHPHIIYEKGADDELKHAYFDGYSWDVDPVYVGGGKLDAAIDDLDHLHIVYQRVYQRGNIIEYIHFDGNSWNIDPIEDLSGAKYASIALDSERQPHISFSYYDHVNDDNIIGHAYYNGDDWIVEIIDSFGSGSYNIWTEIAVDNEDHIHLVYQHEGGGELKYAYFNGASWDTETIFSEGLGSHLRYYPNDRLVVDSYGNPHVIFNKLRLSGDPLAYAYRDISGWHIEDIGRLGTYYPFLFSDSYCAIGIDSDDIPHIVCRDKYAKRINHPPVIESFIPEDLTPEVNENETLEFSVIATDPDDEDILCYTWTLDGEQVSTTDSYSYTPDYDAAGSHIVEVIVRDRPEGGLQDTVTWDVNVVNVNRPPEIDAYKPTDLNPTVCEGRILDFSVGTSDPDSEDTLYFSWLLDEKEVSTTESFRYEPGPDQAGVHIVDFIVRDREEGGLTDSQSWEVHVIDTFDHYNDHTRSLRRRRIR